VAKLYQNVKTPFSNMSYTPDIPSSALQPQEYNSGQNVRTNNRGVVPVLGDQEILSEVPGVSIFVSAGYRQSGVYWFVVGTLEGRWFGINSSGITNLTPGYDPITNPEAALPGYYANMPITDCWNGDVLFINDSVNVPMYLIPTDNTFRQYDNEPDNYVWNYNPNWQTLSAGFMRIWCTPNVGSILIAGNLTVGTNLGITQNFPTTVRWSQAFGLNSGPTTWAPTLANIANELEIPVRGPVVDGFPCNGKFYLCSYWDTVMFSPINYQTTNAPIIGVSLLTQGRGLLNENCWANNDQTVYGLDARDIWVFDGQNFKSLGNQRVKDWFYANLNPQYAERTFLKNNTALNQIEIYFPDLNSTTGWCNKMLSYRYDLDVFQPPKDVTNASHAVESPQWTGTTNNPATRCVVYSQAQSTEVIVPGDPIAKQLVQTQTGNVFLEGPIQAEIRRDNLSFGEPYSNQILVHRVLPEVTGTGNIAVTVGGASSIGQNATLINTVQMPIQGDDPWIQVNQNHNRVTTVIFGTSSDGNNDWELTAANWQIAITEDSR
jgi:hypothetical protein